jgi:hypothetical protein
VLASDEERRLRKLHDDFIGSLQSLPENRRAAVIKAAAFNVTGKTNPYIQAVASQLHGVSEANDKMTAARAEIAEIEEQLRVGGHRPGNPEWRGQLLTRREELEQSAQMEAARAVSLASDDHQGAREEAIEFFREADAKEAKATAILDAADRLRAEAAARDVENRARGLVDSERRAAGLRPVDDK